MLPRVIGGQIITSLHKISPQCTAVASAMKSQRHQGSALSRQFSSLGWSRQGFPLGARTTRSLLFGSGTSLVLAGVWASSSFGGLSPAMTLAHCSDEKSLQHKMSDSSEPAEKLETYATLAVSLRNAVTTFLALSISLASWGLLVAIWVGAITLPFVLLAAVLTARWRSAAVLTALFATPHLVPIPVVPLLRNTLFFGIKRWLGPEPMVRIMDYSASHSQHEPEAEPGTQMEFTSFVKKQLFCYHPHGIYSMGLFTILEKRPDVTPLSAPFLYHFAPIFRLALNFIMGQKYGSVSRSDLNLAMKNGEGPLMLVPGGFHEATISCPGHERVYLKTRRGFVKYALRHGYDLVPCYTIGESDLMHNPQGGWRWRFFLNALSIPAVLPWGFPLLPLLPHRGVELVTAIGPPVKMPRIREPTNEQVKEHHERYVAALKELYARMRPGTASANRDLEVW